MDAKFRLTSVVALALLVSLSMSLYGWTPASATTIPGAVQAALMQPPPQPPSGPPPGSGSEGGEPSPPYEPPSEPDTPVLDEDEESESAPAMPSVAPYQAEPLPDPSGEAVGAGPVFDDGLQAYQVQVLPTSSGLTVSVDKGCYATYDEGESIQFSVTGDWDVNNPTTDWWRYLEVWGSTNGDWWHQVVPGRWVQPRESVYRSAWIASPVGDEQIYARFLDQFGTVLAEANCYYTSQEVVQPPSDSWIECGDTLSGYVGSGQEDYWYFPGSSGRQVTIWMYGDNGFDTYLELYDPNNTFLQSHDDISSNNKDSIIRQTLSRSGTYTISAHGYDYRAGSYSLYIRCQ
jgi:hypothetical protein